MYSWNLEKLIVLYLLKKSFSSFYRDDWYIFRTILVSLCYYFFYLSLLHNSDGAIGLFFRKQCTFQTTQEMGKISNWAIFYSKYPAENTGNGISETLNWNIFRGNMPTDPPTLGHLPCYNVSSPCEYTFKMSRYAPEVAILFRLRKLFHAYNWLSKPWFLLQLTQKIKIIESNCKIQPEFQFWDFKC